MPINPAPPKAPGRRPAPARPVNPSDNRTEGLKGWAQIGQILCVAKGWKADAAAIGIHAPGIISETVALARDNESLAKGIDYLCAAGPYTALVAVCMPLLAQIAANHGKLDAATSGIPGIQPPELLVAKMEAEMERNKLAIMKEIQDAQREAEKLHQQMLQGAAA